MFTGILDLFNVKVSHSYRLKQNRVIPTLVFDICHNIIYISQTVTTIFLFLHLCCLSYIITTHVCLRYCIDSSENQLIPQSIPNHVKNYPISKLSSDFHENRERLAGKKVKSEVRPYSMYV